MKKDRGRAAGGFSAQGRARQNHSFYFSSSSSLLLFNQKPLLLFCFQKQGNFH